MNEEQTKVHDEPLNSFIGCAKFLLLFGSLLGLLGWLYVALVAFAWHGFPKSLFEVLFLFYPFIYLTSAIYCCLANIPRRALFNAAVLLNLPLIPIVIYTIIDIGTFPPGMLVPVLFIILWILLYLARRNGEDAAT